MTLPPDMGLPNTMSEADYAALPEVLPAGSRSCTVT